MKLHAHTVKDTAQISETEFWNTYFDPLLLLLIADPSKLILLRWINQAAAELASVHPDAVISERDQMTFGRSYGYEEAKVAEASCDEKGVCRDLL